MSLEKSNSSLFSQVHDRLKKFFENTGMYPDFPDIPDSIRGSDGYLRKDLSVCKKGASYFIVNDYRGEYRETLEDIFHLPIIFHFTQWELDSSHIGEIIRDNAFNIIDSNVNVAQYEEALRTVLLRNMYNNFSKDIQIKLEILNENISFPGIRYLEGISLICHESGRFIVLDTDVDFSRYELEQIKEAVFV